MSTYDQHQQQISDDADRKNRFSLSGAETPRSASQPPTINGETFYSSAAMQIYGSPGRQGGGAAPWPVSVSPSTGRSAIPPQSLSRSASIGVPSSVPRASSFSASAERERSYQSSSFANAIRESQARFPSTFEDDESEAFSDAGTTDFGDERYNLSPSNAQARGRTYLPADTRSRSQSLATTTRPAPMPIGSPLSNHGLSELGTSWSRSSGPQSIPANGGARAGGFGGFSSGYGDIKPPGSRYGSLGGLARSPVPIHGSSPGGLRVGNDAYRNAEISNISPFVRDVTQILEDGTGMRDMWGAGHGAGVDSAGPPSGTTSRRHSVSIVQPRRGVVGFNAPDNHGQEEGREQLGGGSRNLMIDDDELASGLSMLNFGNLQPRTTQQGLPPSQPSSLPIYAPLSRNPAGNNGIDALAIGSYAESLSIPTGEHFPHRNVHSPSEHSGYSGGSSPPRTNSGFEGSGSGFGSRARPSEIRTDLSPQMMHRVPSGGQQGRYIPGNNLQYGIPEGLPLSVSPTYVRSGPAPNASFMQMAAGAPGVGSPLSPTSARSIHHQQGIPAQQYGVQVPGMGGGLGIGIGGAPMQRRSSQSELSAPPLSDLGRGIPLHAVPAHWTLFIVEFKAGRTDLFYTSDQFDIHVGDLVIVEADRGRDLGKVINDTITAAEVEAFQRQQILQAQQQNQFHDQGYGGPTSPDGPASHNSKKEINPKKIYGKATMQDTQ